MVTTARCLLSMKGVVECEADDRLDAPNDGLARIAHGMVATQRSAMAMAMARWAPPTHASGAAVDGGQAGCEYRAPSRGLPKPWRTCLAPVRLARGATSWHWPGVFFWWRSPSPCRAPLPRSTVERLLFVYSAGMTQRMPTNPLNAESARKTLGFALLRGRACRSPGTWPEARDCLPQDRSASLRVRSFAPDSFASFRMPPSMAPKNALLHFAGPARCPKTLSPHCTAPPSCIVVPHLPRPPFSLPLCFSSCSVSGSPLRLR